MLKSKLTNLLLQPSSFEREVATWKVHATEMNNDITDFVSTCNFIDENKVFYPNIHKILLLLPYLPVRSCSCEQSFSALRCLKTWCCNSMTDECLNNIALGYINQEWTSPESILQAWVRSRHRYIHLASISKSTQEFKVNALNCAYAFLFLCIRTSPKTQSQLCP